MNARAALDGGQRGWEEEIRRIKRELGRPEMGAGVRAAGGSLGPAYWSRQAELRRKQRRAQADELVDRARFLPESERALVLAIFGEGKSVAELAPLVRVSATSLRRRLRRILNRLLSPQFFIAAYCSHRWTYNRRRVATLCLLHGLSMRRACESLDLSFHTVRRHRDALSSMLEAVSAVAGERGRGDEDAGEEERG